jgi:hypothetical protein
VRKPRLVHAIAVIVVALLVIYVARNTEWGDVTIPAPLRGEAVRNPFYAAQALVTTLGATSERRESLGATPATSIVVLSTWGWDIDGARRAELERWVESGGRLVVDAALVSGSDVFERWSGIVREREDVDAADEDPFQPPDEIEPCGTFGEFRDADDTADGQYEVCNFDYERRLTTSRPSLWQVGIHDEVQAMRVAVGTGSVTAVNGVPFVYRALFEGDHGELFVAAADLRAGDHVVFMSEEDAASLPVLVWLHGAPVVVVLGVFIALALWRGAVRFGPLLAPLDRARRSLGEQILGTGRFVARFGGGAVLQSAAARALHEAAARRVAGYAALPAAAQAAAIARLTGVDAAAVAAALQEKPNLRSLELRAALALLESARRRIVVKGSTIEAWKPKRI